MEKSSLAGIIRKRLVLEGDELSVIVENPKYQRLFENAAKASGHRIVAEVVALKECHRACGRTADDLRFRPKSHDSSVPRSRLRLPDAKSDQTLPLYFE